MLRGVGVFYFSALMTPCLTIDVVEGEDSDEDMDSASSDESRTNTISVYHWDIK